MTQAILKQFRAEGGFKTNPSSNFGDIFATKVDVDSIVIDSNSISTKTVNQNLNLITTGTGAVSVSRLIANTINASTITGNLTGNVTGDVTGNLTGNVTGNLIGNVTGNINSSGTSNFANAVISGGSINNVPIGQSVPNQGSFTTVNATNITGPIGNITKNIGKFTSIESDGQIKTVSDIDSTNITSGSILTNGGVGIAKNLNVGGNVNINGVARASAPVDSTDLTNKTYVDFQDIKGLAYAVAFGL
jgi:hypothetical protein